VSAATAIDLHFDLRHSLNTLGDQARIRACLEEAPALAAQAGDRERQGWAAAYLTNCLYVLGDHEAAVAAGERALAIGAAVALLDAGLLVLDRHPEHVMGGPRSRVSVTARAFLAGAHAETGDFVAGEARAREALVLAEASGDAWEIAHARWAAGVAIVITLSQP
jgi:tetratricopeptide (TPR) repeat protein